MNTQNPGQEAPQNSNPTGEAGGNPTPGLPPANPVQNPGQPNPAVPPTTPQVPNEQDNYQQRYKDAQAYINRLEQENRVNMQQIEAQTQRISSYEQRIGDINREITRITQNVNNPKIPVEERNLQYNILRDLRQQRDQMNTEVSKHQQTTESYNRMIQEAHAVKSEYIGHEIEQLCQDPELLRVYGDPQTIYNIYNSQVVPYSMNNQRAMEQYLFNKISLKDMFNQVTAPQRKLHETLYAKKVNDMTPGGGANNPGANPAPAQKSKLHGGLFS